MRSIRRVQNDCSLLELCSKDETIKDKVFERMYLIKLLEMMRYINIWYICLNLK